MGHPFLNAQVLTVATTSSVVLFAARAERQRPPPQPKGQRPPPQPKGPPRPQLLGRRQPQQQKRQQIRTTRLKRELKHALELSCPARNANQLQLLWAYHGIELIN